MVRTAVREASGEPRDITPLLMEMIALLRLLTSQSVYLDTGQLVGELAPAVNRQLGQEAYYGRRERINGR
jgi:hypothetical protein